MSSLMLPALILNKNWQPISVQPVTKAICMVFNENAKIIDPVDYQQYHWGDWANLKPKEDGSKVIKLVGMTIRVPEVIYILNYSGIHSCSIVFNRKNLYIRDQYTCQYCNKKPGSSNLTVDHIMPRSRGGQCTWLNCVLACYECNRKKSNLTPQQSGMKLLREPYKPKWSPLFRTKTIIPSWERFLSEMYWNVRLEP